MLLNVPRAPPIEAARKNLDQASKSLPLVTELIANRPFEVYIGTAQDKEKETKDRAGQTMDAQGVDSAGEFGANANELVEADALL
jgi:hypothetical protein